MATLSNHHRELTNGVGKCSVPMWCGGLPAGFCDEPAYGNYIPGAMFRDGRGEMRRYDGKYSGYVPALACPHHGGPDAPPPQQSSDQKLAHNLATESALEDGREAEAQMRKARGEGLYE